MLRQTLQRQFRVWTLVLVVVPSLLIMAIYTFAQVTIAKQQNLTMISQRVYAQERLINYWLTERLTNIHDLSQSEVMRTLDEQRVQRALTLMQQTNKNFDSLSYIDKNGFFQMSTLNREIRYPSTMDQPYFQAALAGKEYISDIVIGRNSGLPLINFSAPIYDYAGTFQGIILGSVRTTTLETLLHENIIGETGEVFLANQEGIMLTEPRHLDVLIARGLVQDTAKMKFKIAQGAIDNIQPGQSNTGIWVDYLGNKVLGTILNMPGRNWTLIGKINEEEVLAPIYKQLAMMAGGTLCLILLFLPLATLLTNRIKRPIEWLIRQSNLIAVENYGMVNCEKCSENMPHELVTLSETFVKMSHKIENTVGLLKDKEAILERKVVEIQDINAILEEEISERQSAQEKLSHLNADLETRVLERTVELQDLNAALEEEISERQTTMAALRESRDALQVREAQLKHYASELMETNKELQSFANIIAHDFRAPMVNMTGFSQELGYALADLKQIIHENRGCLPEKHQEKMDALLEKDVPDALAFINSSVNKLDRMVIALLNLARAGRRDLIYTDVDMNGLAKTVLLSFNHQIEKRRIQIIRGPMPQMETDSLSMEQIISNLLDNAIKYLEPGRPGKIEIHCTDNINEYLFSVQDNGRGIAQSDYEKIFEIFRRAGKHDVPGEGMGLAYVKALIRQLNGKVWCESEPGVGTKILFTIAKHRIYNTCTTL